MKQKVEILKALVRGAKILILDEPTAVLTTQETVELFKELRHLKEQGYTIVFISHKLNEIMEITDRLTIMRGGALDGRLQHVRRDEGGNFASDGRPRCHSECAEGQGAAVGRCAARARCRIRQRVAQEGARQGLLRRAPG